MRLKSVFILIFLSMIVLLPVACKTPEASRAQRAAQPLPPRIQSRMVAMNMPLYSPIMVRLFKEESALEVWKQQRDGRYGKIAEYEICKWSGKLGPKYMEGDRQAPEGFYTITRGQMNPNSNYYLSFDLGFPNAYDKAHGRTGRNLMVHGSCSSAGCYSMTDKNVAQIYAFGRDSFMGGQRSFQVEAFPFRMTPENMVRYRNDPNYPFWMNLREGYAAFEKTKIPPKVDICAGRYVFNSAGGCTAGSVLQTAFTRSAGENLAAADNAFYGVRRSGLKPPAPSILNRREASLVADWSRRRAAGQHVSLEPPSLTAHSAEMAGAPDILARHIMRAHYKPADAVEKHAISAQKHAIPDGSAIAMPKQKPVMQNQVKADLAVFFR